MTLQYFCVGAALNSLVNVETLVRFPPGTALIQGGSPMPLTGGTGRRLLSKRLKRSGNANAAWLWGYFETDQTELKALRIAVLGDITSTVSRERYVIMPDENGDWSPFLCHIDAPYIGQSMDMHNDVPRNVRFDIVGGVLQYLTKTGNYTVTVSDHLIYCDTTSGSITLTLPALSGVTADIPFRFVKTAAANNLVLDGNGAETVDGGATKTITALNASTTIIKSSATAWVSI